MNCYSMFIDAIVDINVKDAFRINASLFLNHDNIKSIKNYYKFDTIHNQRLVYLANKLCRHYNKCLMVKPITNTKSVDLVFQCIKNISQKKFKYITNILFNYHFLKKSLIKNEHILQYYIMSIINNYFNITIKTLWGIFFEDNNQLIDKKTVDSSRIQNLVSDNLYNISYKYIVPKKSLNFIESVLAIALTQKEMDNIENSIIKINAFETFISVEELTKLCDRIYSKVQNKRYAPKVLRIRYKKFNAYLSEILPMKEYCCLRKDVNKAKYTGNDGNCLSKHDFELSNEKRIELVEITSVGYGEKEKMEVEILNKRGFVSKEPTYDSPKDFVSDMIKTISKKVNNSCYKEKTTLLIDGTNISAFEIEDLMIDESINQVKLQISSWGVFDRVDFIMYNRDKLELMNIL